MSAVDNETNEIEKVCKEVIRASIEKGRPRPEEIARIINSTCQRYGLKALPSKSTILSFLPKGECKGLQKLLRTKPVRTASGIAVIAVMSKPFPCPHGTCLYCPGGPKINTPQSYTGQEPAAQRGVQNSFDPHQQIRSRLNQLCAMGHDVGKVELIIMGGTFLSFPSEYQNEFVKGCYDALNEFKSKDFDEAKKVAEGAKIRNVGLTFETRPDFCKKEHIDLLLNYGTTRVEIGVQTLDDEIYRIIRRGHRVKDVVEAFQIAKDSALKIVAHMMPGLPGSDLEKDLDNFRRLFYNDDFKPDMIKIYPTLVIESSDLYNLYINGAYTPYDEKTLIELLVKIKEIVPNWVRIMRVQRDIPAKLIVAGAKKSNLRELVKDELLRKGLKCKCIRCREVGLKELKHNSVFEPEKIKFLKNMYKSSEGVEIFISYEDVVNDTLISFLRLRLPSERAHRREISSQKSCLVRELHVYGSLVPVGSCDKFAWQHKGFGKNLMKEAERLAEEEFDAKKLVVMSAIGTREYYHGLGYELEGPYMTKPLR